MSWWRRISFQTKLVALLLAVVVGVTALGYALIKLSVDRALSDLAAREGRAYDLWVRTLIVRYRGQRGTLEGIAQFLEGGPRPLGFVLADPHGRVVLARDPSLLGRTLSGQELAAGIKIEFEDGTQWTMVPLSRAPPAPLYDRFMGMVNRSLWIAGLVAAALALVLAWLLVRHLAGPLRGLERAASRIAAGDLAARVPAVGDDELGRLAQAFNAMAESLEQAERAKRQMIADVAHELRTPITILRAAVEGFEDGVIAPTPENLSALKDKIHLTARLIDDLQQLALADMGHLTLRKEAFSLGDLVADIAAMVEPQLADAGISLATEVAPEVPPVHGDRQRVQQVLLNLLANAMRHTPAGGAITVGGRRANGEVEVWVDDTGSGIPPGEAERIFDRFYRAGNVPPGSPGSGLGLSVAKAIVEAHGGRIWAQNRPEGGASFRFTLPAG